MGNTALVVVIAANGDGSNTATSTLTFNRKIGFPANQTLLVLFEPARKAATRCSRASRPGGSCR